MRSFGLSRSSPSSNDRISTSCSHIGLIVVEPWIAVLALLIPIDARGPIFFRQLRVGRDGEQFRIFKFRSMVQDAEAQKEALRASQRGRGRAVQDRARSACHPCGKLADVAFRLMNCHRYSTCFAARWLVGPRPLVIEEDAKVIGLDRSRLHLTPGMTGPWQVLGARVPMQEMVGIDYLYVANWSLWLDLKILLRTVRHMTRRGNV